MTLQGSTSGSGSVRRCRGDFDLDLRSRDQHMPKIKMAKASFGRQVKIVLSVSVHRPLVLFLIFSRVLVSRRERGPSQTMVRRQRRR